MNHSLCWNVALQTSKNINAISFWYMLMLKRFYILARAKHRNSQFINRNFRVSRSIFVITLHSHRDGCGAFLRSDDFSYQWIFPPSIILIVQGKISQSYTIHPPGGTIETRGESELNKRLNRSPYEECEEKTTLEYCSKR